MWNAISPGFELVSPCPIPATITITPLAPPIVHRSLLNGTFCDIFCISFLYCIFFSIYFCSSNKNFGVVQVVRVVLNWLIANGPGDQGSIPGCVISTTLKLYLIPLCLTLSNIRYVSRVKWSNPGKGVAPSPTPWCSSYWKGSLWFTLD